MKINYENYPILKTLQNQNIGNLRIFEVDKYTITPYIQDLITSNWNNHCKFFKKEINIISRPFAVAVDKSRVSLLNLFEDIVKDKDLEIKVEGTYIVNDRVYMIYFEKSKNITDEVKIVLYAFNHIGAIGFLYCRDDSDSTSDIRNIMWVSRGSGLENTDKGLEFVNDELIYIILYAMFKTYATVETKILPPNQKRRDITCLYRNNTDFKVTYLDCRWFTTLVKSEGFNVRGHFRLQPKKKDGEWTRELIWINEFHKTGYTAPARILSYTT
jgi:hypothetical protein